MPGIFFPSSSPRFADPGRTVAELKTLSSALGERNALIERICLFGSYAEGNACARSDADVLVVLSRDRRPVRERLEEFLLAFADAPVPVDVLVCTRSELDEARKEGNRFMNRAASGIDLYRRV
ncbi:MAG: nucleotidyltransferase domain-containing protein [Elusimicrobia bacterium]|nr:nucleotidyltransferase domain-containing protein [Elusimicrobiota bacterium]